MRQSRCEHRTARAHATPPATMATTKQFTRKEVEALKQQNKRDTVFIIDNLVYDVTQFLDEHPGGHEVLQNAAGGDASEDFEDVGHSLDAKQLMKKYQVGELVAADRVEIKKKRITWDEYKADTEPGFFGSWKFPLLAGLLATVLYFYVLG